MAVYEYLCPKCRNQFELMRPMSEAEKPAKCPRCGSKAEKLVSSFGSKTGDSIQAAGKAFSEGTVVGEVGLESSHAQRRVMAHESLLQQLEEVASKIRLLERDKVEVTTRMEALEREKNETVAKTRALEREVSEIAALITQAGGKVEEILKIGANDELSQQPAVNAPKESTFRERLGEFSPEPQKQPKRLLPQVFSPD
jgi:putative FmdB family regulatory protein